MKLVCTVNVGNYSNISLETNDHDDIIFAKKEMVMMGQEINSPIVTRFVETYFG